MIEGRQYYRLVHAEARRRAAQACQDAPDGHVVTIAEASRTLDQNAAQWPLLQAFSDQLQWPINGRMEWLSKEDWKDILTAAFKQDLARVAPGLDGGMVLLGQRTSKFGKKQFSDWLEFLHATAAAREVDLHYMEHA